MKYKFLQVRCMLIAFSFVFSTLFLGNALVLSDQVFTDTFDGTSYSIVELNSADVPPPDGNPDDISFAGFTLQAAGGNPGGFGRIDHTHDVDRDMSGDPIDGNGETFLQSFYDNQTFSYNPQTDGTISEIQFSLDYLINSPDVDSVFFVISDTSGGSAAAFSTPVANGNWETVSSGPTFQADFSSRDFSGSLDLEFGFGFTSNSDVFFDPTGHTIDVDNFVVEITTIPEPGSVALMVTGLIGLALQRRKR